MRSIHKGDQGNNNDGEDGENSKGLALWADSLKGKFEKKQPKHPHKHRRNNQERGRKRDS